MWTLKVRSTTTFVTINAYHLYFRSRWFSFSPTNSIVKQEALSRYAHSPYLTGTADNVKGTADGGKELRKKRPHCRLK
jgi:hypothetical protein